MASIDNFSQTHAYDWGDYPPILEEVADKTEKTVSRETIRGDSEE